MALEISYWSGRGAHATSVYSGFISSEERTLSGTSAQSGATPSGAKIVRIEATEAARVLYGSNPTATNNGSSLYIPIGGSIDIEAVAGSKVAGIQSS